MKIIIILVALVLIISMAFAFNFPANGGVVVIHSNCTETDYNAATNDDNARGTTFINAVTAATAGDSINLSQGNFSINSRNGAALNITSDIRIHGVSRDLTTIYGNNVANGSPNLGFINILKLTSPNIIITDINFHSTYYFNKSIEIASDGVGITYLKNLYVTGGFDVVSGQIKNGASLVLEDVSMYAKYDCSNLSNQIGTKGYIKYYDVNCTGTSNNNNDFVRAWVDYNANWSIYGGVVSLNQLNFGVHSTNNVGVINYSTPGYGDFNIYNGAKFILNNGAIDFNNVRGSMFAVSPTVDYNHSQTSGVISSTTDGVYSPPSLPDETCHAPVPPLYPTSTCNLVNLTILGLVAGAIIVFIYGAYNMVTDGINTQVILAIGIAAITFIIIIGITALVTTVMCT